MENQFAYILAVLLVGAFLIYQELKRTNKARMVFRVLAVIVAAASLLFMIIPIKYTDEKTTDSKVIAFLTPGVNISNLPDEVYYTSDSAILQQHGKLQISYMPDLLYHLQQHPEISGVKLYGYGLDVQVLNKLQDVKVTFHPSAAPGGIVSSSWPNIVPASEIFMVQGMYRNTGDKAVNLVLEGLGTRLDSVEIAAGKQLAFSLQCLPRQTGRAVYQLVARQNNENIETEPVPFQVVDRPKTKVLVLASFPDFEYKFLRNWLLENKYPALFRTRVSKDKFSTEQVNLDVNESTVISAATFKKYDLVIADDEELARLGAVSAALNPQIAAGLGLIVRLNEQKSLSAFSRNFNITGTTDSITTTFVPVLTESRQHLKSLPVSQPLYLSANSSQKRMVEDQKGKVLVTTATRGSGRITATAIAPTYNWVLNGENAAYASYWSQLINQTSRKTSDDFYWKADPVKPTLNSQVALTFQSSPKQALPELNINGREISVQQHLSLPFYWQATFWPNQKGWNEFRVSPGARQAIYVYDHTNWSSVEANRLIEKTTAFVKNQNKQAADSEKQITILEKSVTKWLFLSLFLISMVFLWFETKILQ